MAVAGALLMTVATGCSGSASDSGPVEHSGPGPLERQYEPLVKLSVPSAYNAAKGWDETLTWVPESVTTLPVTNVPGTQTVAVMHAASNGYTITARSSNSGQVTWKSAPWNPPTPVEGAAGDDAAEPAEIPDVMGVEQDGQHYVVAYAHGMRGKDDLHEGVEVVRLAIYRADASGSSVTPVRQVDVPVSASPGEVRVRADGGRLLVAWGEEGPFPRWSAAVDAITGKTTAYEDANKLLPQCEQAIACSSSRVMAATPYGPLVATGAGGFGIPGRWFSDSVRPKQVQATTGVLDSWNGTVYAATTQGHVLAGWNTGGKYGGGTDPVWSVHDLRAGKLTAQVVCDVELPSAVSSSRDYPVITSPNGRYLAAGPLAFDLKTKRGMCLQGDGNRKTIVVGSLRDDGIAYGAVDDDSVGSEAEPVPAQVNLRTVTGDPKVLDLGTEVPYLTTPDGSGLFITRNTDQGVVVSLRRPLND